MVNYSKLLIQQQALALLQEFNYKYSTNCSVDAIWELKGKFDIIKNEATVPHHTIDLKEINQKTNWDLLLLNYNSLKKDFLNKPGRG